MVVTGQVGVGVVSSTSEVVDGHVGDEHSPGRGAKGCWSAGPRARALRGISRRCSSAGTSNPGAHLDTHGCLRIVLSSESQSVAVVQGSLQSTVDIPLCVGGGPGDAVVVPCLDGRRNVVVDGAVVGGGVALAEEVGLDGGVGGTQPFPIDLVEVVGLEDEGADDAGSRRGLQEDIHLAEHDILVAADGGGIGGNLDVELGSAGAIAEGRARSYLPVVGGTLGEVGEDGVARAISLVGRASCVLLAQYFAEL